ncbi:hypothetical protein [Streptomyces pacificus]|uniref:Uncharacterized protein n=1 Tax=Streptomyces pacificus TaxID=2705029 RepID=A0A6A0B0Y7_9ACTN|nr:hypothetical protein [Streptomyces pacificus]GFH38910.1 hypothetical protein SCWH03_51730 [Streptomyces pacificus]
MPETIHVRGEGGQVIAMDLPLPEPIQQRLTSGYLRRVHADGSPYRGDDELPAPAEATPDAGGSEKPSTPPSGGRAKPAASAPKSEWIGYVVSQGQMSADDAANYTKADLMDMTG